jgi:hypothetical protein
MEYRCDWGVAMVEIKLPKAYLLNEKQRRAIRPSHNQDLRVSGLAYKTFENAPDGRHLCNCWYAQLDSSNVNRIGTRAERKRRASFAALYVAFFAVTTAGLLYVLGLL